MTASKPTSVIIAGAGPVGLLTALRLGIEGIPTIVLEAHHTLLPTTRAMVYQPVVEPVLKGLGLFEAVSNTGFLNHDGVRWRDIDGKILGHLPLGSEGDFAATFHLGQATMNGLILKELEKYPSVEVRFGLRVVGIEDVPGLKVKVMVHEQGAQDDYILETDYVLGADGSKSAVRRILCIPFEGFTWPDLKMIGTDILLDLEKELGYTPLNFFVHPEDWGVVAFTGEMGDREGHEQGIPRWRVAFVESTLLPTSQEEILERAHKKLEKFCHGNKDYTIISAESYWLQHRCAAQARKGRVMLAGDALHSNNPIGGLGLTSGILDAFVYGNAFKRVIKEEEPDSLLTECANSRREAWLTATSVAARKNLTRLQSVQEDEVKDREEFFHKLNTDKENFAKVMRANMNRMMLDTFESKAVAV